MKRVAAAIGYFDGMHLGHRAVLNDLARIAAKKDLTPIAITFRSHPLAVIDPARLPASLSTVTEKEALVKDTGVNPIILDFNEELRKLTAKEWLMELRHRYNVEILVMGYDTKFGCDGNLLSIEDYKRLAEETGIEIRQAPYIEGVSSSAIRDAISRGKMETAMQLLGRPYSISGTVTEGNHLGRTIGFPTANISPANGILIPENGVYEALALLPDGSRHHAMVNIGKRPTIEAGENTVIEAHILHWHGDLYDRPVTLLFLKRLRNEQKFASLAELKKQLLIDREIISKSLTLANNSQPI